MYIIFLYVCVCVFTYMGSVKLRPQIQQSMASYVLYFLLEHSAVLAACLKHPIASLVAKLSARNRAQGPVTPGVKDLRLRMIQQ